MRSPISLIMMTMILTSATQARASSLYYTQIEASERHYSEASQGTQNPETQKKIEDLLEALKKEAHDFDRELQTGAKDHEHRLEALKIDKARWDATTEKLSRVLGTTKNDQALMADVRKIGDSVAETLTPHAVNESGLYVELLQRAVRAYEDASSHYYPDLGSERIKAALDGFRPFFSHLSNQIEEAKHQKPAPEALQVELSRQLRVIDAQYTELKAALSAAAKGSQAICTRGPVEAKRCKQQETADSELSHQIGGIIRVAQTDVADVQK